jgi:HAD superfamily hydrolase (TIGR01459 family)
MMRQLSAAYPVWFSDVWGVVHNGHDPFTATVNCLAQHRRAGGTVVLVSNSPRSESGFTAQLDEIGVDRAAYDAVVTSGDVTRDLMVAEPTGLLYHLGPERDQSIFEGLAVRRVPLEQARAVICTGLFNDERETPDDYAALLAEMKARELPMICANPDKQVRKGARLLPCAGALADRYVALGGQVAMAGKPHPPIYALARRKAGRARGVDFPDSAILAIGDGPETDVEGAAREGFACLYVTGGVREHVTDLDGELTHIRTLVPKAHIVAAVAALNWS